MISVHDSSVLERGFEHRDRVKPKTIKLVFAVFPHITQHQDERAKTGDRMMCPSGRHVYPRTVVSVSLHYKISN